MHHRRYEHRGKRRHAQGIMHHPADASRAAAAWWWPRLGDGQRHDGWLKMWGQEYFTEAAIVEAVGSPAQLADI